LPTNSHLDPDGVTWLETEQVVYLHDAILEHYGGGLSGYPHPGGLDSAVHAPRHQAHYERGGCDLYDLAATYLFHIAKAHAFTDGNKRTAYLSALYFLHVNGVAVTRPKNTLTLARATERAVRGDLNKQDLARIMREMPHHPERPSVRAAEGNDRAAGRKKRRGKRQSRKRLL
jgi:death-on-curing protein